MGWQYGDVLRLMISGRNGVMQMVDMQSTKTSHGWKVERTPVPCVSTPGSLYARIAQNTVQ